MSPSLSHGMEPPPDPILSRWGLEFEALVR